MRFHSPFHPNHAFHPLQRPFIAEHGMDLANLLLILLGIALVLVLRPFQP